MDYGAVADGATDDTDSVRAAVEACYAAGGGTVYMPAGTYLFDTGYGVMAGLEANIELKSRVHVLGSGTGSTIIHGTNTNASAFGSYWSDAVSVRNVGYYSTIATHTNLIKFSACSNVVIDNCLSHDSQGGIALYSCQDSAITNCVVHDCDNYGITVSESQKWEQLTSGVTVTDCEAYNVVQKAFNVQGIRPGLRTAPDGKTDPDHCDGVVITRCYGHDSQNNFRGMYAADMTMVDCTASSAVRVGFSVFNVLITGVETALIHNTTYSGTGGTAAFVVTEANWADMFALYGASSGIVEN
jgi:Pectate lyase superfamily protein